jgi:hypothetical protein
MSMRCSEKAPTRLLALGAGWGMALQAALGWRWLWLAFDEDRAPALASPDLAFVHLPLAYMFGQAEARDVTVLLLFNLLREGTLPPAVAGELRVVG